MSRTPMARRARLMLDPCEHAGWVSGCAQGGAVQGGAMVLDYVLGGAVTVFIAAYLVYALLHPERF